MRNRIVIRILLGLFLLVSLLLIWPLTLLPPDLRGWAVIPAGLSVVLLLLCRRFWQEADAEASERASAFESDEKYKIIVEEAAEGIFILTEEGDYLEVNPSGLALTGYSLEEMRAMNVRELVTQESQQERPIRTPQPGQNEPLYAGRTLRRKDGRLVQVEVSARRLRNGTIMSVLRDVTARREAEEQLAMSEMKYRTLFEDNPMPLWMYVVETLRFIAVNQAAQQQYGYSREEFLSMTILDIRPPEFRETVQKISSKPHPGVRQFGVWKHQRKDGTQLDVEIVSHDTVYDGQPVRLVLALDVTEKLKAEKLLQESYADLRRLTSHLEQIREEERLRIAREIHDELGQQLTVLKMDMSWLSRRTDPSDTLLQQKLQELQQVTDATVQTVRRISAELRPGMLEDLGLTATLEWYNQEVMKRTQLTILFRQEGEEKALPPELSVALYRIYQESMTNIIRHADALSVEVLLDMTNSHLHLLIEDDGKGFDPIDVRQRQTLGLLGMRERAFLLGGELTLDTAPGKGTRISVCLPLLQTPENSL